MGHPQFGAKSWSECNQSETGKKPIRIPKLVVGELQLHEETPSEPNDPEFQHYTKPVVF